MIALALATSFVLTPQPSGTKVRLQAISVSGEDVIWASGLEGTFVRSIDGGASWSSGVVEGAEELQFRDVHAVDADTAYLMSAGPGEASRIYKTEDGGATWATQFVNDMPEAFFDCMDFWDAESGLAYSDSVGGEMVLIRTRDGATWERIDPSILPAPLPGEGGFAASGTCATVLGDQSAFVAMGVSGARVLKTTDRGDSWEVISTPVPHGNETSGLTSVAFLANGHGVAAGGDISAPEDYDDNVAMSEDFGESWWLVAGPTFPGAVYAIAYVPGAPTFTIVAVGPGGVSYSSDEGGSWRSIAVESYWSLAFTDGGVGFLVGPEGRLTRIDFEL
ncbi:MAG: hypothetical protein E2P02_06245 [Acidobacteria bacterium]|nr:MAG: hypothetical protein E2P02_06245 [Acidobacteriota bacterium]